MSDTSSDVVVFRVIGELGNDPGHLLLASPDGRWFDYDICRGTVAPVEPADGWELDVRDIAEDRPDPPKPRVLA